MADMMAIVSKAVFEKLAGKSPKVGTRLGMDRYVSANKNLERLGDGGKLYLVTVRPPDEALWLVAILDNPAFDGEQWVATACETPITDISKLKSKLAFDSGKGLPTKKGTLGMSLQTPRAITSGDVELLDTAAGGKRAAAKHAEGFPPAPEGVVSTGAGNRRDLLLQAVIDDPENTSAQQVYADALAGANDPRGEFILLELALAGPLSIRKRENLAQVRAALHKKHAATWFSYKAVNVRLRHGLVVAVSGTLKELAKDAAVFDSEPVSEVEVRGIDEDSVDKLLAAKWLPRVRKLVIRGDLGDDGFAALVGSRATAKLQALNITSNDVTGEGLAALQGNLASCRLLVLSGNELGDKGLAGLVEWEHVGLLETLYLGNCDLTAKGVERLLGGTPLAKLTKLALTKNDLGNGVASAFIKLAAKLPALAHLELRKSGIGTAGVTQLLQAKLPALKKLDVRDNGVSRKVSDADPRVTI